MIVAAISMWAAVCGLGVVTWQRKGTASLTAAAGFASRQARDLMFRLPLALLAASFLGQIAPTETIAALLGSETGVAGILLAAALGGLLPGGPMASFPIALFIWQAGAGPAQMVALLAGWSVFALHRVLAFEAPLLGWRFSMLRLASSFLLPPAAGLIAAVLVRELSLSDALVP